MEVGVRPNSSQPLKVAIAEKEGTMKRRSVIQLAATAVATTGFAAFAQPATKTYPVKPIRWIVPFAPGGGTDVIVRLVAKELETELGQPLIIDNKPGGSTIVGAQALVNSPADGYTWMAANIDTLSANPHLYKKLPYDVSKDFEYAGLFVRWPMILVSNKNFGPTGATALLQSLHSEKNLNYASYGTGTMPHLGMALLAKQLGVSMTHVPYKGSAPAVQGLMSGEVSLMLLDLTTALPQIKAGTIKAYAMTTKERSPLLPDLPTLAEAGVANFDIYSWTGVILPRGVDRSVVARVSAALEKSASKPELKAIVLQRGAEPLTGSAEHFKSVIAQDAERLKRVVADNNITLD